jgi:hypothetical protein
MFIMINRLNKQLISMLCYKTTTTKDIAYMFINQIYYYYKLSQTIVSD